MIVYKHDSRPWLIGYSGGKDSTLLVSLVYKAMKRLKDAGAKLDKTVHVITSDTMVENPIVKNYMHSSSDILFPHTPRLSVVKHVVKNRFLNTLVTGDRKRFL